jgi:hypothetical protein
VRVCVCVCVGGGGGFADYCFVDFASASQLCAFYSGCRSVCVCVCVFVVSASRNMFLLDDVTHSKGSIKNVNRFAVAVQKILMVTGSFAYL